MAKRAHLRVFISATSGDLSAIRTIVRDALLAMECLPVVQEHFAPDHREITTLLHDKIASCDALIHIAGMRYGSEPDQATLPDSEKRRSFTQLELHLAKKLKLPKVFTFVCPEEFPYATKSSSGEPLRPETEELQNLQQIHRDQLLNQSELRYELSSPEDFALRVREIQLELSSIKTQLHDQRRRIFAVGIAVTALLLVTLAGIAWLKRDTTEVKVRQAQLQSELELQRHLAQVIFTYQKRFRDIRDQPRNEQLTNEAIDGMVRRELPDLVKLSPEMVNSILETEAPKLTLGATTPIDLKLAALFVMGEYDATLEQGQSLLVDPSIAGLQTMGDAALARFESKPERKLREDAVRYYRGSRALIEREKDPFSWLKTTTSLANVLHHMGNFADAELLYREADVHARAKYGEFHPDTLTGMANLSAILSSQGKLQEAEKLGRQALKLHQLHRGAAHIDTLSAMTSLTDILIQQANYEEAEQLARETVQVSERKLGRHHSDTLRSITTLGGVLHQLGKYEEAEALYREDLEATTKQAGADHPDTLVSMSNMASLQRDLGEWDEAERLYREALVSSERILGRNHPDTLILIGSLGLVLRTQGKYREAEPLYREAAEGCRKNLGDEHPSSLTAINNLAVLLAALNQETEAEALYREALQARRKVLGLEHPDTYMSLGGLAILLSQNGKHDEAEPLLRETWIGRKKLLGSSHQETLNASLQLAMSLTEQGDFNDAEILCRESTELAESEYGRQHPLALECFSCLSRVLGKLRKHAEAETICRQNYVIWTDNFGSEHPRTTQALHNLAWTIYGQQRYPEAEPMFRKSYDTTRRLLGDDHPATITSKKSWQTCQDKIKANRKPEE